MSPLYAGIGGVVRELTEMYAGIDGVVTPLTEMWTGIGGAKRQIFSASKSVLVQITGAGIPGICSVEINGTEYYLEQDLTVDSGTEIIVTGYKNSSAYGDGTGIWVNGAEAVSTSGKQTYSFYAEEDVTIALEGLAGSPAFWNGYVVITY